MRPTAALSKNVPVLLVVLALATACTGSSSDRGSSPTGVSASAGPSKVLTGPGFGPMNPPPGSSLLAVAGSASDDVWAVGEVHTAARSRSLVEHWDGSSWNVVATPNVGPLSGVAVVSQDVWAVSGSSVIHWNGSVWDSTDLSKGHARSLSSISATGPDDVWVAGERPGFKVGPNTNGWSTLVMHYDGHAWSEED